MYDIEVTTKGETVKYKLPNPAFYEALGYEGMKDLMYRFYDEIYESAISHFFPQDEEAFDKVKKKNSKFFIQICGGPKVYEDEAQGMNLNEYMIRLHDDFSINKKARFEWLGCMETALRDTPGVSQALKDDFWNYLEKFSKLTVNTFDDGSVFYAAYEPGDIVP
ncbi:MAG: globin [Sulfurovum sp.]|nr:MAG: globin [Sulfurovum sp.]RUM74791.1 MAG: globin [Sulfurovum sp.]